MAEPASIRIELPSYSMFAGTAAYQVHEQIDGSRQTVAVFGLRREVVVPDSSDQTYTVPVGGEGRLDLISQSFYGTPELWWAIASCNLGMDPFIGPHIGQIIRVPTQLRLASLGILNI
jgi:hypothetical protein